VNQTPFRVVIAEDEALIRLDLKEMLEEDGYVVAAEASDGEAAVKLTESLRPDLVIMDIKMPGLDGISAAERITGSTWRRSSSHRVFATRPGDAGRDAGAMRSCQALHQGRSRPRDRDRGEPIPGGGALEAEVANLKDRLEVRKLLDRAKGLLQAERGINEAEAFR